MNVPDIADDLMRTWLWLTGGYCVIRGGLPLFLGREVPHPPPWLVWLAMSWAFLHAAHGP